IRPHRIKQVIYSGGCEWSLLHTLCSPRNLRRLSSRSPTQKYSKLSHTFSLLFIGIFKLFFSFFVFFCYNSQVYLLPLRVVSFLSTDVYYFFVMEFASFLKLLNQTDGFGCGIFVFGCFSHFFINLVFLCFLLLLGLKFLFFNRISQKFESCNSFEHKDCKNNGFVSDSKLVDGLDRKKKPIILHWSSDSSADVLSCENCDRLLLRDDGLDHIKNRDSTAALTETELDEKNHQESEDEEESRFRSDDEEDQVCNVITLRKMVKRERKRGDCMKKELEKERRAAESATEEAMAMLLKLRMEKSVVEMEAIQYKRVAEQKQLYDQEVIQSLQWMLMKLDDDHQ
ncbi:PREDICTED: uncharacterized protein LOC104756160, partial [Camelina sativa]|uniref:Uncharacterized protein LOC104756160 n=1 Tax=Camelina sativa TaxID=90675 RepID=A0ABM0WW35_CAMSA